MSANVSALEQKVQAWGAEVHAQAVVLLCEALDVVVPDDFQVHPTVDKLRTSRQVLTTYYGQSYTSTISYIAPTAEWTEFGTSAHSISGGKGLKGGKPLTFFWPKVGHVVHFWEVNWVPGAGVAKNMGWFSRTLIEWPSYVAAAASATTTLAA